MEKNNLIMLCESITEKDLGTLKGEYKAQMKLDGDRIMAYIQNGEVILVNRRGIIKNKQFREIVEELKGLPDCVLDGEVISKDGDFSRLSSRAGTQNKFKIEQLEKEIPVDYMVFDILKSSPFVLVNKPLKERAIILEDLFRNRIFQHIKVCEFKEIDEMLSKAKAENQEGIVIKDMNSIYEGRRSKSWLKLKLKVEKIVDFTRYEENNKGLRLSNNDDSIAVQMSRLNLVREIKDKIDSIGSVKCEVEALEVFEDTGKLRQPVFKRIYNGGDK